MIDLAFHDSAAGSLKAAKHGKLLEGYPQDVAPLTLMPDIGDISDMDAAMEARKQVLGEMFAHFPQGMEAAQEIWVQNRRTLDRIAEAKQTLEPVRMWVCAANPSELLSFLFVCHLFADAQTPLFVVDVPIRFELEQKGEIHEIQGTGELTPERLSELGKKQRELRPMERRGNHWMWCDLVRENAPLRAIINGRPKGVPVDFYDFVLRAHIPQGDFRIARVIGNALGLGQVPGLTDYWLFARLWEMVDSGELVEIAPPQKDNPYSGILRKR